MHSIFVDILFAIRTYSNSVHCLPKFKHILQLISDNLKTFAKINLRGTLLLHLCASSHVKLKKNQEFLLSLGYDMYVISCNYEKRYSDHNHE